MNEKEELLNNFESSHEKTAPKVLTVLPLRDIVIFPYMIFPVLIGRNSTLKAVAEAIDRDKYIFVSAQKDPQVEEPKMKDIYRYGTTARILQVLRLPNNLLKVLLEGVHQSRIVKTVSNKVYLEAEIKPVDVVYNMKDDEMRALIRKASDLFKEYVRLNDTLPADLIGAFDAFEDPMQKLYYAIANTKVSVEEKQIILEDRFLKRQYFELIRMLYQEIERQTIEDEIETRVQETMHKAQKKFFIQEQIRALQGELGDEEQLVPELQSLREQIEKTELPEHAKEKVEEEFERLRKTPTMSPEFSVNRNYIELILQLPWTQKTDDEYYIENVKKILDEDHFDLEKPKDRILEFIAVLNMAGKLRRQILCFVGPPGVGKTSLAKSIARAMGRKFIRFSLGGVRDEAEIRGHRRTYIGALPGKIIQSMKKAETINPVILLDEIDKMAMDFRGDPSSALLEVLDPEQNINFNDHYLEIDYDLSNVMFITTANVMYDIPIPLRDRMEIIELNSYLDPEKLQIAKKHILPRVVEEYGLEKLNINFEDDALLKIIREYTREAGVRNLEREISSVLRKLTKEIIADYEKTIKRKKDDSDEKKHLNSDEKFLKAMEKKDFKIDAEAVEKYLKAPKYKDRTEDLSDKVGVATGLAWTSVGGDILPIEVTIMPGSERLTLTGKLGDVMKESAMAALSYVRSNYKELGIDKDFNKKKEIHIHIPEGAIPKDGPSAGITLALALISAATGRKMRGDLAMTGEITLRGKILAIGGLKEKILAAKRVGIAELIIPKDNKRDVEDFNEEITQNVKINFVESLFDALEIAFRSEK